MRSPGLGRRLSLPGPRPESATALVNRSLRDHGNGLGRGARRSCGSGGSLVAGRGGGAAAAAAALALTPALSTMLRGRPERELVAWWEAEAVAGAKAHAAEEQVRVDPGAAGEPERKAGEEQPKEPAPAQPRAAEEGDAQVPPRPPPTLPMYQAKPVSAQGLYSHGKSRSKSRSCKRSSDRSEEYCSPRPVTVDSSKARTSLDALKISIRQLKWKEVRSGPAAWAQGGGLDDLRGDGRPRPGLRAELLLCATLVSRKLLILQSLAPKSLPQDGSRPLQVKLATPSSGSPAAPLQLHGLQPSALAFPHAPSHHR
ncbi:tubulin polyglutamylase TTLL11-like isoform X1 [Physeter macrocephalus]|uniref:Tubulin polyglutamylase TTLL11-like isoform X1 n=1 Tax=Physeter macrocephalus TaxID=9755 RepID=A0A9W2WII8_PHYMC|nr:tubulin polyglutamylase TTLL11-like isoform X1 [Physeter catodon]